MLNRYFSIYFGAQLIPAVIGFLSITVFTRLLSPLEYGVYVVGMSIAGIAGSVFFAWIRLSVVRYQAISADINFRGTALVAFGATAVLVLCGVPAAVLLLGRNVDVSVLCGSIFVALGVGAFDISQEFCRASLKPVRYAVVGISRSVLGFAIGCLAIGIGWGGLGLLGAVGLSFLIGALASGLDGGTRLNTYRREHLIKFARYGLPLSIGGLSFGLYSVSDRLVVAYLLGEDAAGHYGVATDLPRQFMVMLGSSVAAATFPIVFRTLSEEGIAATRERLNENAELLLAVVVPVAVWLSFAASQVVGTLVGADFRASILPLLPVLAVARMFGVINQFYVQISFQLSERSALPIVQSVATLALSIALMFPFVARFGLMGAAYAALMTEGTGLLLGIWLARRAFRLPLEPRRVAGVLAAAVAMGVAIYAARIVVGGTGLPSLLIVTTAGGLAYAAAAWLLNVVHVRTAMMSWLRLRTVS